MLKEISNLQFSDYKLNRHLRELRRDGTLLPLSGKAFDLLAYMAENPGRPLSKAELLDAVWPETSVEEANLSQNVFLLRKVLGSGAECPIKTLPGRGYQFAAQVSEVPERMQEPAARTHPLPEPGSTPGAGSLLSVEATHTRVVVETEIEDRFEDRFEGRVRDRLRNRFPLRLPGPVPLAGATAVVLAAAVWLGWAKWQRWLDQTGGDPVQVVLTSLDGTTGDPVLDRSLVEALRIDLAQSPFVSVVPAAVVHSTLTQMKHQPEDALTPSMAQEVCERTNSQAVLRGAIARVGSRFLLTEEAASCTDGSTLAAAKREAATADDLPGAIDKLATSLRQKLGESRRSIARFDAPLFPANTASLEALKAYSESQRLAEQGKLPAAIDMLQHAVSADPQFAIAYSDLAAYYSSSSVDPEKERAAIEKAYSLRDTASPLERMSIVAHYNRIIVGDLFESERNYQTWTELYPRKLTAWNGLSIARAELGEDAVAASTRALALRPTYLGLYVNLAMAQMRAGDAQGARATCERAIAQGIDGDHLRARYLYAAYMLHDAALVQAQRVWIAAHPDASITMLTDASIAIAEGRFADARRIAAQGNDLMRRQGLVSGADSSTRSVGTGLIEAGDVEHGAPMLRSSPPDREEGYDLVGLAEVGDTEAASSGVHAMEAEHPQATLWKLYWGPMIHAAIALNSHKPEQAVTLLEPTHLLDGRGLDLPTLRGKAYLAAGQAALAEKEFRFVLAHQGLDPVSYHYPLAWLALGRALAAEGRRAEAADAYQHFFTLWAHADPDAVYLKQAKQEFSQLQPIQH
jgi:DNA-binding winged helix-turn-helix (wHTH) protein/tetratricopeptide (TPR) repeat protein